MAAAVGVVGWWVGLAEVVSLVVAVWVGILEKLHQWKRGRLHGH